MSKLSGRGERIRTSDHLTPSQVRYQAALRPEGVNYNRAKYCKRENQLHQMEAGVGIEPAYTALQAAA